MLDKNHNQILEDNFIRKIKEFSKRNPNIILSSNPFHKCQFLIDLMNFVEFPVIFLDFDLLYSGYIKSKIIQTNEKVMIYQPKKENWMDIQKEIIIKLSKKKILVVIDSLNGFYSLFEDKNSGRFINTSIMFLTSVARDLGTLVLVTGIARKNEESKWILSPTGRHILDSKGSGIYLLKKENSNFLINSLK